MSLSLSLSVALKALSRNKLQTMLTMLGMTIGVAAVLAMIALGSGAQASIEQQVRAAGMNLIVVTAGNYKVKTEDDGGGVVDHQASRGPGEHSQGDQGDRGERIFTGRSWRSGRSSRNATDLPDFPVSTPDLPDLPDLPVNTADLPDLPDLPVSPPDVLLASFHPEDDPMEKHDHPTSAQRLGDSAAGLGAAATLTFGDVDAIQGEIKGVQYVAPGVHQNARVVEGDKRWFTRLHGGDEQLPLMRRAWAIAHGRFFSRREREDSAQVIVLGSIVAGKLFGAGVDPVGREVHLWNQPFSVVGVVTSTSVLVSPAVGDDQFDAVYAPFTTVQRLLNLSKLNDITITVESTGEVTRVAKEVTDLLRYRHNIGLADPDDFTVATQARQALARGGLHPDVARAVVGNVAGLEKVTLEQLARTLDRASRTMTALLASIAAVSLLVGGIGIMNIMLLSVTERTREIGIRRAVGARGSDVLLQFLVEAVTLSVAGGLVGIVLGLVASTSITRFLGWSTSASPGAVALAFGIAAAVGIFFGFYPARQASRLDPIDSLRYE